MSLNVNYIYSASQNIINSNQTGNFKPILFNAYAPMAVVDIFSKYAHEYQATQQISDALYPFIHRVQLSQIPNTTAQFAYPSANGLQYVNLMALRYRIPNGNGGFTELPVQILTDDELGRRLQSPVVAPSTTINAPPVATQYDTYVQLYPETISTIVMVYLRQPVTPYWNYTIVNGLPVYTATGSTDFEFNWKQQNELIIRICQYFGVYVRDQEVIQVTEALKQQQIV
jgi:hypothetical protein